MMADKQADGLQGQITIKLDNIEREVKSIRKIVKKLKKKSGKF